MHSHEKRRAKLALADEDCQYDGVDYDEAKSLWKNYCGTMEIQWSAHLGQQENRAQDAQRGRPARPFQVSLPSLGEWPRLPFTARIERAQFHRARSASKKGTWPLPSLLADFFSILLE